jgi:hypothetical protein
MALPQFKTQALIAPAVPNLPLAPPGPDQQYLDQLNNVLRLYFNQLNNFNQLFTTNTGGSLLQFPNGAFHQDGATTLTASMSNVSTSAIQVNSTDQFESSGHLLIGTELIAYTGKTPSPSPTFTGITRGVYGTTNVAHNSGDAVTEALGVASSTTSIAIPFDSTDTSNGVSIDATTNSKVVFATSGYYNIQFSAQLLNFTTTDDNVTFWWKQNGEDVAYSAGIQAVPAKHGSSAGAAIVSWNIVLPITADDYVQLYYASESGNTVTATYPAGTAPVHPVSPSVILTATFVSALYP